MRRKDREITDLALIEDIISKAYACHLGLVDGDLPYVVAMNYGYVSGTPSKMYFHCAAEGKKLDIIAKNNNACFQLDINPKLIVAEKACAFSMNFQSVMGHGKIQRVESEEEKALALNAIMKQYTGKDSWEYNPKVLNAIVVLRMDIETLTGKQKV
jgi:nitroimidazol reductase NimA-like FMN-containing flavoprotein (pyridoxamine 5'-phosphate oxidase superfamily)